jgi:hypothetical protein
MRPAAFVAEKIDRATDPVAATGDCLIRPVSGARLRQAFVTCARCAPIDFHVLLRFIDNITDVTDVTLFWRDPCPVTQRQVWATRPIYSRFVRAMASALSRPALHANAQLKAFGSDAGQAAFETTRYFVVGEFTQKADFSGRPSSYF